MCKGLQGKFNITDVGAACQLTTTMADAAVQVKRGARANKVTAPAMYFSPCAWGMARLPALRTGACTHRIIT